MTHCLTPARRTQSPSSRVDATYRTPASRVIVLSMLRVVSIAPVPSVSLPTSLLPSRTPISHPAVVAVETALTVCFESSRGEHGLSQQVSTSPSFIRLICFLMKTYLAIVSRRYVDGTDRWLDSGAFEVRTRVVGLRGRVDTKSMPQCPT